MLANRFKHSVQKKKDKGLSIDSVAHNLRFQDCEETASFLILRPTGKNENHHPKDQCMTETCYVNFTFCAVVLRMQESGDHNSDLLAYITPLQLVWGNAYLRGNDGGGYGGERAAVVEDALKWLRLEPCNMSQLKDVEPA